MSVRFKGRILSFALGALLCVVIVIAVKGMPTANGTRLDIQAGTGCFLSEDRFIGEDVIDSRGAKVGAINDVIIDARQGRLAYALVCPEGYTGTNDVVIPVPWNALKRSEQTQQFVLNMTKEDLEMAPRFQKDKSPDLDDPCWEEDFRPFYNSSLGAAPDQKNRPFAPDESSAHFETEHDRRML